MSFSYAMIFGIGMVGGGGDPGFAFPFPVILTGLIDIWTWVEINLFFTGFILPLAFWWTLIFIVMLIKERMARRNLGLKETTESLHEFKK